MLSEGLLDEGRRSAESFDPDAPSSKAIGAAEVIEHVKGRLTIDELRDTIVVETRQYAKRQRTWFRSRMRHWRWIDASA